MSVSERNADDGGGGKAAAVAMYALPLLAFLILKGYARAPVSGDEHIYMYAGLRVAEGLVPYREIFLAHPPLHLLIAVIWMLPGFYPPFWVKSAAIAPAAATLLILVFLLRRSGLSRPTVFLAGMLMALSMDFLTVSTHFTGANWSMLWLIVGTGALAMNRPIIGAAALAVSGLTSFHVLPAAGGALFLEVLRSRKKAIRTLLVFAGVTLGVHLACLGLFGLALYTAEQSIKEIGIRKVLGASVSNIVVLFSKEFSKWVLLANIIGWPVAYFAMTKWLANFAYRTSLNLWIFFLAGALAFFIALLTVSYHSIKAAVADPVKALRYE